jgi:hypothetical protein
MSVFDVYARQGLGNGFSQIIDDEIQPQLPFSAGSETDYYESDSFLTANYGLLTAFSAPLCPNQWKAIR